MSERLYNKRLKNQDKPQYRHKDLNQLYKDLNHYIKT